MEGTYSAEIINEGTRILNCEGTEDSMSWTKFVARIRKFKPYDKYEFHIDYSRDDDDSDEFSALLDFLLFALYHDATESQALINLKIVSKEDNELAAINKFSSFFSLVFLQYQGLNVYVNNVSLRSKTGSIQKNYLPILCVDNRTFNLLFTNPLNKIAAFNTDELRCNDLNQNDTIRQEILREVLRTIEALITRQDAHSKQSSTKKSLTTRRRHSINAYFHRRDVPD